MHHSSAQKIMTRAVRDAMRVPSSARVTVASTFSVAGSRLRSPALDTTRSTRLADAPASAGAAPTLKPTGSDFGGKDMKDAIALSVDHLTRTSSDAPAWPLPQFKLRHLSLRRKPAPVAPAPATLAASAAASKLPLIVQNEAAFDAEAARLFKSAQPGAAAAHQRMLALAKRTVASDQQRLSGQFERPLALLQAVSAICGNDVLRAEQVMHILSQGLDITKAEHEQKTAPAPVIAHTPVRLAGDPDAKAAGPEGPKKAPPAPRDSSGDKAAAWRTAQLLATSGGVGFEALLALSPVPVDPAVAASDARRVADWEQATAQAKARTDVDPAEVVLDLKPVTQQARREQSLLLHLQAGASLEQARDSGNDSADATRQAHLTQSAAVKLWRDHGAVGSLSDAEKTAHFDWRQNLREAGPQGNRQLASARLDKSVLWPVRSASMSQNWLSRANPRALFGQKKAPFLALGMGAAGAQLDSDTAERGAFDQALKQAIGGLKDDIAASLTARPGTVPPAQVLQRVNTLAMLENWQGQIAQGLAPESCDFKNTAPQVHQRALELAAGLPPVFRRQLEAEAKAYIQSCKKQPCTLEALEAMGHACLGAPGAEAPPSPYRDGLTSAKAVLAKAQLKPADLSIDAMREFYLSFSKTVRMGPRLRVSSGGVYGVNNTTIPFPASPDVRYRKGRNAVVEYNTGGHAHELGFGVEQIRQRHVGAQGGLSIPAPPVAVGLSTGGNTGADESVFTGVRLRFLRRLNSQDGDLNLHQPKTAQFINSFFDAASALEKEAKGQAPKTPPGSLWKSLLVDRYFDDPDFSVSWQDHRSQQTKVTTSKSVSTSAFAMGVSVTHGHEENPHIGLMRSDTSGATARSLVTVGSAGRDFVRTAVGVTPPGFVRLPLLSAEATLNETGKLATVRTIEEHGRLLPNLIYKDVTYQEFGPYQQAINHPKNRPAWEALLGGKEKVDEHLQQVEQEFAANQRPAIRWRLRADAVKLIDASREAIVFAQAALRNAPSDQVREEKKAEIAGLKTLIAGLLSGDPTLAGMDDGHGGKINQAELVGSWNLEEVSKERGVSPVNWMLSAGATLKVAADRELTWQGVSTKTLNQQTAALNHRTPPAQA
ncbi:hypothetical protein GJA_1675 [Janthinobacterium agaricidamnosum NBRC 102515 = DSM 9628]|uniref:Type III effector protein n=1 Tax=Janthinobacterium agaricidamnosum NBRC 102515 = DSM 9628 TaxID=1349767 RepID=W0V4N2_9BURK|nr:hypothetical protein GJA_1675 [Janthinobacterium agaricidamnosum NBRC 102515 = DSM 9628]